jgi:hypothetical protein
VVRVSDQEDASHGRESIACDARERSDGSGSALRVALEDEALIGIGGEDGVDVVDDLSPPVSRLMVMAHWCCNTYVVGALGRDLGEVGRVDGIVDGAARDLGLDVPVHGDETARWALSFASAAGVDDCWSC